MPEVLIAHVIFEDEPADICLTIERQFSSFGIMAYRNFYAANRDCIDNQDFNCHKAAIEYCLKKFGVTANKWKPIPENNHILEFASQINSWGVPALCPVECEGKLLISIYEDGQTQCIDLAGDTDGLRTLGKYLLLASENSNLDHDWHHHFSFSQDIELTLRGPQSVLAKKADTPKHEFI